MCKRSEFRCVVTLFNECGESVAETRWEGDTLDAFHLGVALTLAREFCACRALVRVVRLFHSENAQHEECVESVDMAIA